MSQYTCTKTSRKRSFTVIRLEFFFIHTVQWTARHCTKPVGRSEQETPTPFRRRTAGKGQCTDEIHRTGSAFHVSRILPARMPYVDASSTAQTDGRELEQQVCYVTQGHQNHHPFWRTERTRTPHLLIWWSAWKNAYMLRENRSTNTCFLPLLRLRVVQIRRIP